MNKSNHVDLSPTTTKNENSSMTTVNILGRLRLATEQIQNVRSHLANEGKENLCERKMKYFSSVIFFSSGLNDQVDLLDKVSKELDGMWQFNCFSFCFLLRFISYVRITIKSLKKKDEVSSKNVE